MARSVTSDSLGLDDAGTMVTGTRRRPPCHTPSVKLRYPVAVSMLACLAVAVPMTSPATAEEATTIFTAVRWGGSPDQGQAVVMSATKRRIVTAYSTGLVPTIRCSGTECEPDRPARIEVLRKGTWKTWATGTLAELADSTRSLTSKRDTTVIVRSVLPADDSLAEITSLRWSLRFLPASNIALAGTILVRPGPSSDYGWRFRREPGSVTLRVTPAATGRTVELRDSLVEGFPLIGKATTDSFGRATITADFADVRSLTITLLPTREQAGWTVSASPVD